MATNPRTDPGRRDRIIDAALDVIAREGVDGTSQRKIAAAAGVPLGSITYYFEGRTELLHQAFTRFANAAIDRFVSRMRSRFVPHVGQGTSDGTDAAIGAVVDLVVSDGLSQRDLILCLELYTLAAREPAFRTITDDWMRRSRIALTECFDPETAMMVDAYIEGAGIHRALRTNSEDEAHLRRRTEEAVRRLVTGPDGSGGLSVGPLRISTRGRGPRRR